jgi:Rrf2 family protein
MRLPTRVRYAVRAIVELAERQATGPVSVRALAEAQGISSKYGKQLLNRLQKAGIVKGFPGLRGGYVLARKPEAISVLDVCMAMDGGIDLVPCVKGATDCGRRRRCSVRSFWKGLGDSLEHQLRSATIDQLAGGGRPTGRARRRPGEGTRS